MNLIEIQHKAYLAKTIFSIKQDQHNGILIYISSKQNTIKSVFLRCIVYTQYNGIFKYSNKL